MLKIAICDDNAIQLDIIQEELKKNIKEDISYTIDTFNSEAAFTQTVSYTHLSPEQKISVLLPLLLLPEKVSSDIRSPGLRYVPDCS